MRSATIHLESAACTASIVPDEGGRIQHLVDGLSGRELLLQRTPADGPRDDFLASCAGGWDELFPNDSAWRDHPDHGRLWTQPFRVDEVSDTALRMSATIPSPSVEIVRRVALLGGARRGLRSEVKITASAPTGPFLWAAHPMLGVSAGWKIELPATATDLEVDRDLPGRFGSGHRIDRPEWEALCEIPPVSAAIGELVYVDAVGEARVGSVDGRSTTKVTWDTDFFRHLWLVVITGAYGLDDCLLIEPCTSRPYRLDDAIHQGTTRSLAAGEQLGWWVEVESLDEVAGLD